MISCFNQVVELKCFNSWGRIPLGSLSPTRRFLMNHCLGVRGSWPKASSSPYSAPTIGACSWPRHFGRWLNSPCHNWSPFEKSSTLLLLDGHLEKGCLGGPCFDRFGWKPSRSSLASGTWNKWSIDAHSLCLGFIPQISTEIFGVWPEIWQKEVEISRFGGSSSLIVGGQFGNLPNLAGNLCQVRQLCWERMRHHPGRRHGQWGQMMAMGCPCDFVCRHNNVWLGLLWSLRCWG